MFSKSYSNRTTLVYSPPFPLMLTYGPRHENLRVVVADLDADFAKYGSDGYQMDRIMEKSRLQSQKSKPQFLDGLMLTYLTEIHSFHMLSKSSVEWCR